MDEDSRMEVLSRKATESLNRLMADAYRAGVERGRREQAGVDVERARQDLEATRAQYVTLEQVRGDLERANRRLQEQEQGDPARERELEVALEEVTRERDEREARVGQLVSQRDGLADRLEDKSARLEKMKKLAVEERRLRLAAEAQVARHLREKGHLVTEQKRLEDRVEVLLETSPRRRSNRKLEKDVEFLLSRLADAQRGEAGWREAHDVTRAQVDTLGEELGKARATVEQVTEDHMRTSRAFEDLREQRDTAAAVDRLTEALSGPLADLLGSLVDQTGDVATQMRQS